MKKPVGKLLFAHNTIANLEVEVNKLRTINLELIKSLQNICDACDGNNPDHAVFYFTAKNAIDNTLI